MVKVWCGKWCSWRIAATVIVFLLLLVSLPSRDEQLVFHSQVLPPVSGMQSVTLALTPDDQSAEAASHFARAQRAVKQKQWDVAQSECERALCLAETFRFAQANASQQAHQLKLFQRYHEFYLALLAEVAKSSSTADWAARAWEANERAHWWRWQQKMSGLAGKSLAPMVTPLNGSGLLLNAVRQRLLDDQTELLEYALGETQSYLWRITLEQVEVHLLPRRALIEATVKSLRNELSASEGIASAQSHALREWLLPHLPDVASASARRWLIVADGVLQDVPFSWLAPQLEITQIPAAYALLRGNDHQQVSSPAPDRVAVLADPVFGKHDERLVSTGERMATRQRSATDETAPMSRLPFARREAENLARHFVPFASLQALDFAASRELALSGKLASYPIVHFATHGVTNAAHPERSGLVLSQVNERGVAQAGLLKLRDICRMKLPAELVVLSACESHHLAEGFLYAGAHRVLGTLWPVDDAATSELMARFYDALLAGERFAPATALRRAQLSLARKPQWAHPHYWAGFVMQGEW